MLLSRLLQSCPTLCDPRDGSPPGSLVPGILQVRTLEWVAISFSNAWKWKLKVKSLSRVQPLATPWTVAYHVSPSMGVSRQEYWSGLPFPSPVCVCVCVCVCVYKIPFAIQQKLTQHCKSTILQYIFLIKSQRSNNFTWKAKNQLHVYCMTE